MSNININLLKDRNTTTKTSVGLGLFSSLGKFFGNFLNNLGNQEKEHLENQEKEQLEKLRQQEEQQQQAPTPLYVPLNTQQEASAPLYVPLNTQQEASDPLYMQSNTQQQETGIDLSKKERTAFQALQERDNNLTNKDVEAFRNGEGIIVHKETKRSNNVIASSVLPDDVMQNLGLANNDKVTLRFFEYGNCQTVYIQSPDGTLLDAMVNNRGENNPAVYITDTKNPNIVQIDNEGNQDGINGNKIGNATIHSDEETINAYDYYMKKCEEAERALSNQTPAPMVTEASARTIGQEQGMNR